MGLYRPKHIFRGLHGHLLNEKMKMCFYLYKDKSSPYNQSKTVKYEKYFKTKNDNEFKNT